MDSEASCVPAPASVIDVDDDVISVTSGSSVEFVGEGVSPEVLVLKHRNFESRVRRRWAKRNLPVPKPKPKPIITVSDSDESGDEGRGRDIDLSDEDIEVGDLDVSGLPDDFDTMESLVPAWLASVYGAMGDDGGCEEDESGTGGMVVDQEAISVVVTTEVEMSSGQGNEFSVLAMGDGGAFEEEQGEAGVSVDQEATSAAATTDAVERGSGQENDTQGSPSPPQESLQSQSLLCEVPLSNYYKGIMVTTDEGLPLLVQDIRQLSVSEPMLSTEEGVNVNSGNHGNNDIPSSRTISDDDQVVESVMETASDPVGSSDGHEDDKHQKENSTSISLMEFSDEWSNDSSDDSELECEVSQRWIDYFGKDYKGVVWDHETVVSSSVGVSGVGLVKPLESPSSTTMMSPSNTSNPAVSSQQQKPTPPVHRGPGKPPGTHRPSSGGGAGRGSGRATPVSTPPAVSKISDSDAANIRRSQRQQDRIARQEAERIREENQLMLQREKEQMQTASQHQQQQHSGTYSAVIAPSSPASPAIPHPQPVNVGIVSSTQVTIPANSVPVTPVATPTAVDRIDSTSERSEGDGGGSGRRSVRNRKLILPAQLAVPNYLSLEDATTAVKELTRRSSTTQQQDLNPHGKESVSAPGTSASVSSKGGGSSVHNRPSIEKIEIQEEEQQPEGEGGQSSQDGGTEEEDDPNVLWCICRQPHNYRFMICCDRCEDWFHGKCVSVTKEQGKAMELKNVVWHCPPCKEEIQEGKEPKMAVIQQRQEEAQTQQTPQTPVTTQQSGSAAGRGRKSSTASASSQQMQSSTASLKSVNVSPKSAKGVMVTTDEGLPLLVQDIRQLNKNFRLSEPMLSTGRGVNVNVNTGNHDDIGIPSSPTISDDDQVEESLMETSSDPVGTFGGHEDDKHQTKDSNSISSMEFSDEWSNDSSDDSELEFPAPVSKKWINYFGKGLVGNQDEGFWGIVKPLIKENPIPTKQLENGATRYVCKICGWTTKYIPYWWEHTEDSFFDDCYKIMARKGMFENEKKNKGKR